MKSNLLYLLIFASVLLACNSSTPKTDEPKFETYTSKEIGWTIEIPKGYKPLSQNRIEANEKKGKEALGKVAEGEVSNTNLIHLVNFQKNQFNSLSATAEPYDLSRDGEYIANNQLVKKLIFDTYTNQKIKVDTLSGTAIIAGNTFYTFNIKLYGPSGEVLMNQIMYNQLIKGYDFGVNINYNNETDKDILINAFKNSKFSK
ncbi:hypothetical protein FA048_04235 [Pedobacter polaris]|uniref:DUF4840 domain-containing protein n=1 Tax=Pedobacter polaris TaxID=2571273 RepID=A0A4V5P0G1_9SPHI|nr:hypothetical protein [Pedobacter polaris]TKC12832.1 hypothetical protein FA048_04235 [Pedobacter polaris]